MKETKVLFVGNYKGGVGKTASVLNFAEYFTKRGKKVLVLDIDPQSSLSEILVDNNGGQLSELDDSKTLNYIFDLNIRKIKKYNSINLEFDDDIVQSYEKGKYDFIASSLFYTGGGLDELAVKMEDNIEYLSILKNYLDSIISHTNYDYIIIDCPPANNLITRSAFLLADYYIIPTILDNISTNGVAHYINTVQQTYKRYCEESEDALLTKHFFGDSPILLGVFGTFIRGRVNYDAAESRLIESVSRKCEKMEVYYFDIKVNNYIDIARSNAVGVASSVRDDYEKLSAAVLDRIEQVEQNNIV